VAVSLTGCIESSATPLFATFLYQQEQMRRQPKKEHDEDNQYDEHANHVLNMQEYELNPADEWWITRGKYRGIEYLEEENQNRPSYELINEDPSVGPCFIRSKLGL